MQIDLKAIFPSDIADKFSANSYNCGGLISSINESGQKEAALYSAEGSFEDFCLIKSAFKESGYYVLWQRKIEENEYIQFVKEDSRINLAFSQKRGAITLTEDINETSLSDFSYSEERKNGGRCEFFMYGLNMDTGGYNPLTCPELNTTGFINCGMLFAIKNTDGSIILFDGGSEEQFNYGGLRTLDRFLHQISGKGEKETVTVSAWYISHAHEDHLGGLLNLFKTFPERYRIERMIANFPSFVNYNRNDEMNLIKELSAFLKEKYPCCIERKVHTGEEIRLGGVTIDILYTQEDGTNAKTGKTAIKDFNDTVIISKITFDGISVMMLADMSGVSEARVVTSFSKKTLGSDIVQTGHHNFNYLPEIYPAVTAPIALFTQTEEGTVKNEMTKRNSDAVKPYSKKFYYNGDITKTVGFAKIGEEVREIYRYNAYIL